MASKKKASKSGGRPRRVAERTHSEDGVDLTLIRRMLLLTPAERLDVLERSARAMLARGSIPKRRTQRDKLGMEFFRRALDEKNRK